MDAINSIPRYAKFLKSICTTKRENKLKAQKKVKVKVNQQVSSLLTKSLPPKCSDPGMFAIPCTIEKQEVDNAMLDLGASINVMPYSTYKALKLAPMTHSNVVIQLADRSSVSPRGMVEDVLVKVDKMTFPADFYVLDMDHDIKAVPLLLGRPFLKTASTKIDVATGNLSMSDGRDMVTFNIFDKGKYLHGTQTLNLVEKVDTKGETAISEDKGGNTTSKLGQKEANSEVICSNSHLKLCPMTHDSNGTLICDELIVGGHKGDPCVEEIELKLDKQGLKEIYLLDPPQSH